jgi:antagonist of KipI
MRGILIHNPGLLTTIQGGARKGYLRFGMPGSGAMDKFAMRCANYLVGNDQYSAILECTLIGPEIEFLSSLHFSITGAECSATLDNRPIESWRSVRAKKRSILRVGTPKNGARIYIAFSGGLSIEKVMGSVSTYLPGKIGGFNGRSLRKGDIITTGKSSNSRFYSRSLNSDDIPVHGDDKTLRLISGVDYNSFPQSESNKLKISEYTVSQNSDRMGIRLSGTPIGVDNTLPDVISYGIGHGTVQIPGDGNPIIMCVDSQTTGGYRQIANIISADLDIVAQLGTFQKVRFKFIDINEAVNLLKDRERYLNEILL